MIMLAIIGLWGAGLLLWVGLFALTFWLEERRRAVSAPSAVSPPSPRSGPSPGGGRRADIPAAFRYERTAEKRP